MPVELLAPAGSPEALDAAIGEGADAVYLGLKNFNARMRSTNFTYPRFEAALRTLRRMGKKTYVTVNTVFEQREADRMYQLLKYLSSLGPDALIVQDFGVLAMARSEFPKLKIHASTQMNICSSRGANALSRYGVSRVVLARELCLEELKSIRADTNVEMEVFTHGALCVSASGLCLFSSYLGGKSANRGMCTQACRRLYSHGDESGTAPKSGYYFSPADLQLLEQLPDLAAIGINAIKIEGRMKSADYVGTVTSAYRLVLDAIAESSADVDVTGCDTRGGEIVAQSIAKAQEILRGDFARSKTKFYFFSTTQSPVPSPQSPSIDWLNPEQDGGTGIALGFIRNVRGSAAGGDRQGLIVSDNCPTIVKLSAGDSIRLHRSDDSDRVSHKLAYAEAKDGGYWLSIPDGFGPGDRVYLIQNKAMSKRYKPVISGSALEGKRGPAFEKAPIPKIQELYKSKTAGGQTQSLPEGLYVAVSNINDLYIVQSSRPVKVMLNLSRKNSAYILAEDKDPLPFRPADTVLVLNPYFPQAAADPMATDINQLVERGYRQFVINNPGHFSLFRDFRAEIQLIAGPWLYMFNTWALSFIASLGVDGFVSPYENNRQNLERTLDREKLPRLLARHLREFVFVPVFAWPVLFRIRADLGKVYSFKSFQDSRGELFTLCREQEETLVIPERPFSITDKIPFLKEAGFRRFIIDLSGPVLKKKAYKDLMRSIETGVPLPDISRFNWKDGFYTGSSEQVAGSKDK
ncbi:MAG: U32 family peptidase [Treponema sp.]|jgi:putative protease|nr:U32 family peptidase [Treponema sp.]